MENPNLKWMITGGTPILGNGGFLSPEGVPHQIIIYRPVKRRPWWLGGSLEQWNKSPIPWTTGIPRSWIIKKSPTIPNIWRVDFHQLIIPELIIDRGRSQPLITLRSPLQTYPKLEHTATSATSLFEMKFPWLPVGLLLEAVFGPFFRDGFWDKHDLKCRSSLRCWYPAHWMVYFMDPLLKWMITGGIPMT